MVGGSGIGSGIGQWIETTANYAGGCAFVQDVILGNKCPLFTSLGINPTGSGCAVWHVRHGRLGSPQRLQGIHSAMANNLFSPTWARKMKGAGTLDRALECHIPVRTFTTRRARREGHALPSSTTRVPVDIPDAMVHACPEWVGFGAPPHIVALVETLMSTGVSVAPWEVAKARGASVAVNIQRCVGPTSVPARCLPPTQTMPRDARVCLGALHHMGLKVLGAEVPVGSPTLGFATAMDLLATDTQDRLVVVEIKTACGGMDWGDPVNDPPVGGWRTPLDFLPRSLRWEAAVQAWLTTLAIHKDYHVPTHCLAWVVLIYRGPMIPPLVTCSAHPLTPTAPSHALATAMAPPRTLKRKFQPL